MKNRDYPLFPVWLLLAWAVGSLLSLSATGFLLYLAWRIVMWVVSK